MYHCLPANTHQYKPTYIWLLCLQAITQKVETSCTMWPKAFFFLILQMKFSTYSNSTAWLAAMICHQFSLQCTWPEFGSVSEINESLRPQYTLSEIAILKFSPNLKRLMIDIKT